MHGDSSLVQAICGTVHFADGTPVHGAHVGVHSCTVDETTVNLIHGAGCATAHMTTKGKRRLERPPETHGAACVTVHTDEEGRYCVEVPYFLHYVVSVSLCGESKPDSRLTGIEFCGACSAQLNCSAAAVRGIPRDDRADVGRQTDLHACIVHTSVARPFEEKEETDAQDTTASAPSCACRASLDALMTHTGMSRVVLEAHQEEARAVVDAHSPLRCRLPMWLKASQVATSTVGG